MHLLAKYSSSFQLLTLLYTKYWSWYSNVQGEQRQLTASSLMVTVKTMQALMMTAATPLCLRLTQTECLRM